MHIKLAFSPCPNDTFIFDALVNQYIDTEGFEFTVTLKDVEALNNDALEGVADVSKVSYGVLPLLLDSYKVLNSGSALGKSVGPLLIRPAQALEQDVAHYPVAIPGLHTTAHLLFSLAYPGTTKKLFLRYDEIEQFVLNQHGLGVIIHENRFTYEEKGLVKISDLGDYWERSTGHPIPLGGIVVRKDISTDIQVRVDRLIRKSIEFAYARYPELSEYIRCHAQEMSDEVMRKHINLYVNKYSLALGEEGKLAIEKLMQVYSAVHGTTILMQDIFVPS